MKNLNSPEVSNLMGVTGVMNTLTVLRHVLNTRLFHEFESVCMRLKSSDKIGALKAYGNFVNEIYLHGGNLGEYIRELLLNEEYFYVKEYAAKTKKDEKMPECMNTSLQHDLEILQAFIHLTPEHFANALEADFPLPTWEENNIDLIKDYYEMLENIGSYGYGIFSRYRSFKIVNHELVPVKNADPQSLDQLYGYERERMLVYKNTEALANGKSAANVLLYGDAGTGKSSTIKACAKAFASEGVRLIEFDKNQLADIPALLDKLYDNPLKFIFFIDDLSFTNEDEDFCHLKGILEGNATGKSDNVAIYASSNRRHLVRELTEDRNGSDLHLNDTLQQTMSLSARFGLTITFSKPEQDLYFEIIDKLASEAGISMDADELHKKAEAFAIRSNGRSPRTAKQFIQQLSIGLIPS